MSGHHPHRAVGEQTNATTKRFQRATASLIWGICVLVILMLGVAFATQDKPAASPATAPVAEPSDAPSLAPTATPALAPTSVLDQLYESLRNHTMQSLGNISSPQCRTWSWLQNHTMSLTCRNGGVDNCWRSPLFISPLKDPLTTAN